MCCGRCRDGGGVGFLQLTTTTREEDSSELSWAGDLISTVADMSEDYEGDWWVLLLFFEKRDVQLAQPVCPGLVGAGCGYSVTDLDPCMDACSAVRSQAPTPRRGEKQRSFQNNDCILASQVAYLYTHQLVFGNLGKSSRLP